MEDQLRVDEAEAKALRQANRRLQEESQGLKDQVWPHNLHSWTIMQVILMHAFCNTATGRLHVSSTGLSASC